MSSPITAALEARAKRRRNLKSRTREDSNGVKVLPDLEKNQLYSKGMVASREPVAPAVKKQHSPRLGFLGVGWIGRHRLEAIARSEVAEIAAILDPAPELAAQAVQVAPGARLARTFDELMDTGLDGLV